MRRNGLEPDLLGYSIIRRGEVRLWTAVIVLTALCLVLLAIIPAGSPEPGYDNCPAVTVHN